MYKLIRTKSDKKIEDCFEDVFDTYDKNNILCTYKTIDNCQTYDI